MVPGTLCDQRLFAAVARRLRPAVSVQVARWRDLLRSTPPRWWQGAQSVSLLGFSLGGIWALDRLRAAGREPRAGAAPPADRGTPTIERLALVASNAEPAGRLHAKRIRRQRHLLQQGGTAALARAAKSAYFAVRPPRWQARLVVDMARRTPAATARKQLSLAARRADGLSAFAGFPGPVAVLSGHKDRLCPPPWQQRLQAARPDAVVVSWPDCGHMLPLEAPGRLAQAIVRWLERVPLQAPWSAQAVTSVVGHDVVQSPTQVAARDVATPSAPSISGVPRR